MPSRLATLAEDLFLSAAIWGLCACGGHVGPAQGGACVDDASRMPDAGLPLAVGPYRLGLRSLTAVADPTLGFTAVVFSESTDACQESMDAGGSERRTFVITMPSGKVAQYPVGSAPSANAASARIEHVCPGGQPPSTDEYATAGTVEISAYDPNGRVRGQYDLVFPTGEHVMSTFDACFCSPQAPCSTALP